MQVEAKMAHEQQEAVKAVRDVWETKMPVAEEDASQARRG
jgi:Zn-dependent oligopeptidase